LSADGGTGLRGSEFACTVALADLAHRSGEAVTSGISRGRRPGVVNRKMLAHQRIRLIAKPSASQDHTDE
jgi:hypothetical protein